MNKKTARKSTGKVPRSACHAEIAARLKVEPKFKIGDTCLDTFKEPLKIIAVYPPVGTQKDWHYQTDKYQNAIDETSLKFAYHAPVTTERKIGDTVHNAGLQNWGTITGYADGFWTVKSRYGHDCAFNDEQLTRISRATSQEITDDKDTIRQLRLDNNILEHDVENLRKSLAAETKDRVGAQEFVNQTRESVQKMGDKIKRLQGIVDAYIQGRL